MWWRTLHSTTQQNVDIHATEQPFLITVLYNNIIRILFDSFYCGTALGVRASLNLGLYICMSPMHADVTPLTLESPASSASWLLDSLSLSLVSRPRLSLSRFLSFLSLLLLLFRSLSLSRDRDLFRLRSRSLSLLRDRDLRLFSFLSGLREELRLCLSLAILCLVSVK